MSRHRAKNTLAVVQVLADQTFATDPRLDAFLERLQAVGRANDLLLKNAWQAADLREAMELGLQVAEGARERIVLAGPALPVAAESVANIALAVHELTTNALKYGALSAPGGQVEIRWSLREGRLLWLWRESGGPPVSPPAGVGFGSKLIRILAAELKGEASVEYRPDGLSCRIEAEVPRA